jgi:hypothetical protein
MSEICPSCGYDIGKAGPVERGDLWIEKDGSTWWRGTPVPLIGRQREILHALARESPLRAVVLADRTDLDENAIYQFVSRINRTFIDFTGAPVIRNVPAYYLI